MADFTYKVDLDSFIKDIDNLEKKLDRVLESLSDAFVEIGDRVYERLLQNIENYGLGGTELASTASIEYFEDGFSVSVGAEYAFFIEFGTGIVGATNPHPQFSGRWAYDVNGHGEQGWYYPTTESDPNPYKHYYNGILYGFTRGMPSRPFMYQTWLYGTRIVSPIVKKHIRRALS